MKSKTIELINYYTRLLKEQAEEDPMQQGAEMPPVGGDVQDVVEPQAEAPQEQETAPMTSEGENEYIANLIDAALFKPTAEEAKTLMNLQNVMQLKRYTNAREEVLPMVLSIISPETQSNSLKQNLSDI
jgi:hypothetical protein